MADLSLSASVTRTLLALPDLALNDHVNYYLGAQILGGDQPWNRTTVGGAYMDGEITVNRNRKNVVETLSVWVMGDTAGELMTNLDTLKKAFSQDSYVLSVTLEGQNMQWRCEAADLSYQLTTGYIASLLVPVTLSVPRRPVPLAGAI